MSLFNSLTFRQKINFAYDVKYSKLHQKCIINMLDSALNKDNNLIVKSFNKNYISTYLKCKLENELIHFLKKQKDNELLLNIMNYLRGNLKSLTPGPNTLKIKILGNNNSKEYEITDILDIISYHKDHILFRKNGLTNTAERIFKYTLNQIIYNNRVAPDIKFDKENKAVLLYENLIKIIPEDLQNKIRDIIPNNILISKINS
jgi:hypothetical protein